MGSQVRLQGGAATIAVRLLVDTSAWSPLLRHRRPAAAEEPAVARKLREHIEARARIYLTGIIYQELLEGFRLERDRARLINHLRAFPMLQPSRATHEGAARLRDRCLKAGVSLSTGDALVAQVAIDNRCALLTADDDFRQIAGQVPLRLA
jgi:predicted nucleic acid-binding protein